MANNKIRMPSSGAGLTTFYEESRSKVVFSPIAVLVFSAIVVVVTILLNVM